MADAKGYTDAIGAEIASRRLKDHGFGIIGEALGLPVTRDTVRKWMIRFCERQCGGRAALVGRDVDEIIRRALGLYRLAQRDAGIPPANPSLSLTSSSIRTFDRYLSEAARRLITALDDLGAGDGAFVQKVSVRKDQIAAVRQFSEGDGCSIILCSGVVIDVDAAYHDVANWWIG